MANERRLRFNFVAGGLSVGLSTVDTTMQSNGLQDMPALASDEHTILSLFQTDVAGRVLKKELVKVTAHSAGAGSATIQRGQFGTTAQTWSAGDRWAATDIADDNELIGVSGGRYPYPYEGFSQYDRDTGRVMRWNGGNWIQDNNLRFKGTPAQLIGAAPAIDTGTLPFLLQAGTTVFTSDGNGYASISFATPFPNGLICPICVAGSGGAGTWWLIVNDGGFSLSGFQVRTLGPGGAVSVLVRAHWMAIGW